jgi:hypothetical protein
MAKKFAGFTPEQMGKIVPEMQGMQADEQAAYLASQPGAAARVGKMAEVAQKRIGMAEGGLTVSLDDRLAAQKRGFASAGQQQIFNNSQRQNLQTMQQSLMQSPEYTAIQDYVSSTAPNLLDQNKLKSLTGVFESSSPYMEFENASKAYNNYVTPQRTGDQSPMTPVQPERQQLQLPDWAVGAAEEIKKRQDVPAPSQSVPPHSHTIGMHGGGYAGGGMAELDASKQKFADAQAALTKAQQDLAANPEDKALADAVGKAQAAVTTASSEMANATSAYSTVEGKSAKEIQAQATGDDPSQVVTKGAVSTVSEEDKAAGKIGDDVGVAGDVDKVTQTTATGADPATVPVADEANLTTTVTSKEGVQKVLDDTQAEQGTVSDEAQVTAAQGDTSQLSQLELEAAQGAAAQVQGAPTRTVQQLEMISGSTVDQAAVQQIYGTQKLEAATVSGEMDRLMKDFDSGKTPGWAAGAMRNAAAKMAARGLSSSSMAGMAIVQAAMESAVPIAQMDAANKQQVAVESAKQRAAFLNLEFNQEFETKVRNAAKISEIANMNFNAEQQIALENAKMAQTMNLANLSNRQAKVMSDAAAMSQMDMTNLNNRQAAQVQNAKAFLEMDMANLSNKQATTIFKAQQMTSTLLSDTAAENASRQFNASSQNQTDQFFANLSSQVERFNVEQSNQLNRFNAGEANAITQFNASQQSAREQFNATNGLVIAQANAQWFQATTTAETAAQNQMNRDAAVQANKMTETAYNSAVQMERDAISYAFRAAESAMEREIELTLQGMRNEMDEAKIQAEIDKARGSGWGAIANTVAEAAAKWAFS